MTNAAKKTYALLFSDLEMGHDELGWMPRDRKTLMKAYSVEDEDAAYTRFLKNLNIVAQVHGGYAVVTEGAK